MRGRSIRVAASAPTVDLLGRLCLVTRLGSVNLCEGLVSLAAAPGEAAIGGAAGREVELELGPVAADFARALAPKGKRRAEGG